MNAAGGPAAAARALPLRQPAAARLTAARSVRAWPWAAPVLLTLFALALRVIPWLADYPLHRDEALYGAWARLIASGRDPLLLTAWVDKPPLAVYLMAGSLRVFGVSALALRVPGMLAALLTTPVVYALACRLCRAENAPTARRTAALAAALFALSPFAILFAPTAFTDGWLTLCLLLGAWAALAGRPFWAGLALGLAVAGKQQGLLAAPLVIGLLGFGPAWRAPHTRRRWPRVLGGLGLALLGFALIFGPLMYWDSLRWAKRPSFWDRSVATYGGLTLAAPATWLTRAAEWGALLGYFYARPALSALIMALAALGAYRRDDGRRLTVWRWLGLYSAGYIALHWLFTFQPWDRYLLPLAPLAGILAARGVGRVLEHENRETARKDTPHPPWSRRLAALLLAAALGWSAWQGMAGRLPVGSDHGAYEGLDRVLATLTAQPADAVIYHQSLGWFFDFYLFDARQERRWWGTPWKLADDADAVARREPLRSQWVVVTAWEDAAADEARRALAARGLALVPQEIIHRTDGSRAFLLYRILPVHRTPRPYDVP